MKKILIISIAILFLAGCSLGNGKKEEIKIEENKTEAIVNENVDYSNLELYKDQGNLPHMVGETIIKDIDGDGKNEKVLRYDLAMADRVIQELYIYREINGEYKIIKTFSGDPYGFAKMINEDTIIVGKYLHNQQNWVEFEGFEITKYKWTKDGEVEISKDIIKTNGYKDLSEEIKSYYL